VEPRFLDHAEQEERAKLVGDFAPIVATIMDAMNIEDILRSGGQGP
jgi:hypothetical protein